ncbi:MAG: DUF3429 domain-containing protein [Pseudomonadota bacterium]
MQTQTLMAALGYSGLLPFYVCAFAALFLWPGQHIAAQAFLVYATVILAFLGGTLWGYAVTQPLAEKHRRLVLSNLVALLAAGAALLGVTLVAVLLLALGQITLLLYERAQGDPRGWYLSLRTKLTLGALPAHGLMVLHCLR